MIEKAGIPPFFLETTSSGLGFTFSLTIAPLAIPMTVWVGYDWTFYILCLLALASSGLYWLMFYVFEKQRSRITV
ncbi:hypothetical protein [Neobacillus vireti]|uniref:hypothetical protein n=1 Tax=Neobacillus vireti TaxID=220686 RepID=UPI0030000E3E